MLCFHTVSIKCYVLVYALNSPVANVALITKIFQNSQCRRAVGQFLCKFWHACYQIITGFARTGFESTLIKSELLGYGPNV